MTNLDIPRGRPIPVSEIPPTLRLRIVGAAGAGFPSPAQDWEETAIDLIELLRLDRTVRRLRRVFARLSSRQPSISRRCLLQSRATSERLLEGLYAHDAAQADVR